MSNDLTWDEKEYSTGTGKSIRRTIYISQPTVEQVVNVLRAASEGLADCMVSVYIDPDPYGAASDEYIVVAGTRHE